MVLFWGVIKIKFISNPKSLISGLQTETILNLGNHGFADSFFPKEDFNMAEDSVPLVCQLDKETGLVQLLNFTEPKERYSNVDYSYTSSNSRTSRAHWKEFAQSLNNRLHSKGSNVLEIGSNDGFLLGLLKSHGFKTLGVDASKFTSKLASERGITTLEGIFGESEDLTIEIMHFSNSFDIIIANNVLNHSNNPLKFVESVKKLMSSDGIFVFEVPYWLDTINSLHFDQIYHEHVTYFTAKSARALLRMAGLVVVDIQIVNYHGGSLRITASHLGFRESKLMEHMIEIENREGLFTVQRYEKYFQDICEKRDKFMKQVLVAKESGKTLFGIGAAAKANTLLTFYNLNNTYLDFILDASIFKQGKITPVTKIPIYEDSHISNMVNLYGIILAWNISEEVKRNILSYNAGVEFMTL